MTESCCTCASLLSDIPAAYDEKREKSTAFARRLECCNRAICTRCINGNPRFQTYCPFCQVSIVPSPLPQGLRDPPSYSPPHPDRQIPSETQGDDNEAPPPYDALNTLPALDTKGQKEAPDVLHFVAPDDSVTSLSLRYGVPAYALRKVNGLYADHLLAARKTILIPGEYYKGGVSLSPQPVEGEEEELRKAKVRRFMVATKEARYDVALIYLQQADYNLEGAIDNFKADEQWEKEHPMDAARKGKAKAEPGKVKRRWLGGGGSLVGQM